MIIKKSEQGQALILIVFAIVGLIGMIALAVDGGNAYSDRRNAQNAADTAAFAAGRGKVRSENWKQTALLIAAANGYTDTDSTSASSSTKTNVEVYQCDESGVDCHITLGVGDTLQNFIQVKITSITDTYFGSVVGVWKVTNRVNAVVRVKVGTNQPIGSGSAVWSLNKNACSAVTYGGSSTVELIGSGLYVNSKCPNGAFSNTSNSPGFIAPCLQVAGDAEYRPSSIIVPNGCILENQLPLPDPVLPNPTCGTTDAVVTGNTLSPGNWSGAFPPNGVTNLQSGLYCVSAGNQAFSLQGGELNGQNVIIYLKTGNVKWTGGAIINLQAPDSGPYKGLLLYLPPENTNSVSIAGGGDSHIVGTILAPKSECTIAGGGGQNGLQTQITCDTVKFTGNSSTTITYDPNNQYQPPIPPSIELTQ